MMPQGAIGVPQTPAAVMQGRFVRRSDGAYLDTKTGQVYPNEDTLPKEAAAPGAVSRMVGALGDQLSGPAPGGSGGIMPASILGIGQARPAQAEGAIAATPTPRAGWGQPPLPSRFAPPIQIPHPEAAPSVAPAPQGGISPMMARPAAADISKYLNLHPSRSEYADVGAAMPGAQQGGLDPMAVSPKPLAATPMQAPQGVLRPQAPRPQGGIAGGADSTSPIPRVLPSLPKPAAGQPATPQAGAIGPSDLGAIDVAKSMHSAPGAGGIQPDPVPMGGIDAKAMQESLPSQADITANAMPEKHEGGLLDRIFGDGTSTDSGSDVKAGNMGLMRAGLAMMAAGGQPGATLGGSLGQGGLYALDSVEKEKDRDEARAWRKTVFETEQGNKKSALNLDIAKWLTGTKQKDEEIGQTKRRNDISEITANATAGWRQNQIATSGRQLDISAMNASSSARANDLREEQQNITRQRNSVDALNMLDSRAEQDLANGKRALSTEIDPTKRDQVEKRALSDAAWRYPQSSVGQNFADAEIQRLQQLHAQAVQKNDAQAVDQIESALAQISGHFYPDVKAPPGKKK